MPTGTNLTDGQVRSIFALRAEGEQIKAIASNMETTPSVVSRVLRRKTYADVRINQNVLDAIAKHKFRTHKKRKVPVDGTKGGGVVQQAAKNAKDTRPPASTLEELNLTPLTPESGVPLGHTPTCLCVECEALRLKMRTPPKSPLHVWREMGPLASRQGEAGMRKATTKAEAMARVLGYVGEGNAARAKVARLQAEAVEATDEAKRAEDRAFAAITTLGEMGFDPEFLSTFLTECGLCTDGRFTK